MHNPQIPPFLQLVYVHTSYIHIFMKDMHIYFIHSCTAPKTLTMHTQQYSVGQNVDVVCYI